MAVDVRVRCHFFVHVSFQPHYLMPYGQFCAFTHFEHMNTVNPQKRSTVP